MCFTDIKYFVNLLIISKNFHAIPMVCDRQQTKILSHGPPMDVLFCLHIKWFHRIKFLAPHMIGLPRIKTLTPPMTWAELH